MQRRHLVIATTVMATAALAATAFGGTGAQQSASPAKTAKKALKQAKKAKKQAKKAKKQARQAKKVAAGPAGGDLTGNLPNPEIAAGAVGSAEVADDSLSGADIDESSLAQVPDAASVGGSTIVPFNFAEDGVSAVTEILSLGGLVLEAQCPDDTGSDVSLVAKTSVSDAEIRSSFTETNPATPHSDNDVESEDFDPGDVLDLFPDQDAGDQIGQIEYRHGGAVVSVSLQADADPGDCMVSGHAIYSAV